MEEVSAISRIISSKFVSASRHVVFEFGMCTLARDDELLIRIIVPKRVRCPAETGSLLVPRHKSEEFFEIWHVLSVLELDQDCNMLCMLADCEGTHNCQPSRQGREARLVSLKQSGTKLLLRACNPRL